MSLSLCLVWIDAAALAIDDFDFPCIFLAARTSRLTMPVHEAEQDQCQSNALDIYALTLSQRVELPAQLDSTDSSASRLSCYQHVLDHRRRRFLAREHIMCGGTPGFHHGRHASPSCPATRNPILSGPLSGAQINPTKAIHLDRAHHSLAAISWPVEQIPKHST